MSSRKRLLFVIFFVFFLFAILIAQFYKIQIVEGEKWAKQADRQHYFIVKEPFVRGSFFSNTSLKSQYHPEIPQKLVVDIQMYTLFIDPISIPSQFKDVLCKNLMERLEVPLPSKNSSVRNSITKAAAVN